VLLQQGYFGIKLNLFFFAETIPPRLKIIGVLNLPSHMRQYNIYGIWPKWNV
jgi:hypothetical protein